MNRNWLLPLPGLLGIALAGCSSEDLGFAHSALGTPTAPPLASLSECTVLDAHTGVPTPDGGSAIVRLCVEDSQGHYYDPFATTDNQMFVLPAGGEYSFVYEFAAAWVPDAAAASAAVKATFTGQTGACVNEPGGVTGCPGGPQVAESSTTTLRGHVLTQKLGASPPPQTLVIATLDFGVLYASHIDAHPGAFDGTTWACAFETE
jgi:hypothetical protein